MLQKTIILLSSLVLPVATNAAWFGAEFSADAFQMNPQTKQGQPVGKMYVGKDKMRLEATRGNQSQIMIVDAGQHVSYMINPAERTYMEIKGVQGVPMLATVPMPDDPSSPCQTGKMECKKLGDEQMNGVPVEKWEFAVKQKGESLKSAQWLDRSRHMALRQEFPGNQVIERKLVGKEKIDGREVEKWEVTTKHGNQTQHSIEWVDPELRVALKQEHGQGQVTELRNIKEGPQPASLFEVPQGYQKRAMPQGMPGGAPGAGPGMQGGMPRNAPPGGR
jgi:hypothetical protein